MSENKTYTVELSSAEIHSLMECLAELRKHYVDNFSTSDRKAFEHPVFVSACELQHKFAHIVNPDISIPLTDYLDYGN